MVSGAPDYTKTITATTIIEGVEVTVEAARAFWAGKTKKYEDTAFTVVESPLVLAVKADLGRSGHDGYIINDGAGNISIEIEDPVEGWGDAHTLKMDEVISLHMLNVKGIRLTWIANCGYRVMVL